MTTADLAVIAVYLLLTLGVGALASRRATSAEDYFLGARNLPAWAVMLSVVATETSALTVISVPGIAARGDFTFLQIAFGYLIGRIGVAIWLLPGYADGTQQTAYQRLETRFGAPVRRALAAVFLLTRFLADGVRLFAAAIPLALVAGWDMSWTILVLGSVTLLYTFTGGLRAVVWVDVLQLAVYVASGVAALVVALQLTGDPAAAWARAAEAGKLQLLDFRLEATYGFFGSLVGGALLSAASHGTDHIIVQRLLATHSLRAARVALVGSGLLVILQFALFLAVGTALWAAGQAPAGVPGDELFPRFVLSHLTGGLAGLVIAGILAAAMSSSISAMASSLTHDLYATWSGRAGDSAHLLRMGRWFSLLWGLLLIAGALGFHAFSSGRNTPVVVLALSIASVTYGALLGSYVLAGTKVQGRDVIVGAALSVVTMLGVVMGTRLSFLWTVPLGTALTVAVALATSFFSGRRSPPA